MARPRQFEEQDVLRDVRDQFWAAGYAATSLEDLTRASGLGKGSLYGAFGDKHKLFMRTLDDYVTDSCAGLRQNLEESERAVDGLRGFLLAGALSLVQGCYLANSTTELAGTDPEVAERAREAYERIVLLVAATVERAQREGDLPAGIDPVAFARTLQAAQQGLVHMGRSGLPAEQLTQVAEDFVARLLPPVSR
ncbi:TetR/AcrR family transcriptional regulator [Lentzea sp. BCCO 10_0856]|uniref:TetR/AcrR family transcriptional regulator n=1 Tax=Lentzea miocenica TaxID=3095431 RepID=A0ABU4T6F4_9PSEU|nr:TetR/AcrR family transcriptional regulator [Lentzea sp. BCCO 10_0856]MDX8033733.1 TetR/AcrR family transcriptional regulator [Lentzea sp. BCCO 10_0856]